MPQLTNLARTDATFNDVTIYDISTVIVEIPSIKVETSADMDIWYGDVLTYAVMVTNLDEAIEATSVVFTDTIDPSLATLITDSVYVDGRNLVIDVDYTYNATTGELQITPMPNIAPKGHSEISFRVKKA